MVSLGRAVRGEEVMSIELDSMFGRMLNNQVPANWEKVGFLSMKNLSSWVDEFIQRVEFFRMWFNKAKEEELPAGYWLSAFFLPAGFLTAVSQNYARKEMVPIDKLNFKFDLQKEIEIENFSGFSENGVYVYGLYIEGCRFLFDKRKLGDSQPGEMFTRAPIILFTPTEEYKYDPADYKMPLYKTIQRAGELSTTGQSTNYIISIDCKTDFKPDYWVLKGAAMFCSLKEDL